MTLNAISRIFTLQSDMVEEENSQSGVTSKRIASSLFATVSCADSN